MGTGQELTSKKPESWLGKRDLAEMKRMGRS
jgi:hypothetical protein